MLKPPFINLIDQNIEIYEIINIDDLAQQIRSSATKGLTGKLDLQVKNQPNQQWSLFFNSGNLIGCSSNTHPRRRWCRQLSGHCPQLALYTGQTSHNQLIEDHSRAAVSQQLKQDHVLSYESILKLVEHKKLAKDQIEAFFEGHIQEILFDIIQKLEQGGDNVRLRLTYEPISQYQINSSLILVQTEQVWLEAMKFWTAWQEAGLADISPNLAPKIRQPEELKRQTSQMVYRNLTTLADGNQTLRDLSVKMGRNLLLMTKPILSYIRTGLIELVEVGDSFPFLESTTATAPQSVLGNVSSPNSLARHTDIGTGIGRDTPHLKSRDSNQNTAPLVAYIEDSLTCAQKMEQILSENGYRCLNIQDPLQALPMLLEHKPNLIFLDLVMPIANGYEVCAQIRRISTFQDIPVIILTSSDGIVDRVRAKVVGSSGFLAKPIEPQKVLHVLHKYLSAKRVSR